MGIGLSGVKNGGARAKCVQSANIIVWAACQTIRIHVVYVRSAILPIGAMIMSDVAILEKVLDETGIMESNRTESERGTAWEQASDLFPHSRGFITEEARAYKESLSVLLKKTGRRIL
jgi:hypothetical protein